MNFRLLSVVGSAMLVSGTAAFAQQASALEPLAVPNPTYATMVVETEINRPAKEVWAKYGKFCDLAAWVRYPCAIVSGKEGELGAVRLMNSRVIEMLVGKTDLSYTYTVPVRVGVPFNAVHGTVEAKPVTDTTSKVLYSVFYDNSMLADDAARAAEIANRRARITAALKNLKTLAEGGTLPPQQPR